MSTSLKHLCAAASLAAMVALAAPAAASPESDLATAENAYAALDYTNALSAAEAVLAQRGLSHETLTRATRVAALAHSALGHGEQAKNLFTTLLQYDPDFKVDSKLGPRFSEPFAEARGYWQAQGRKPGMEVQAIIQWGQPGQIRVATQDPLSIVKRVVVAYRWAPARDYTTANVDPGARQVDVAANANGSQRIDYYVRALDAKDNAVFEDGTPDQPKTVVVNEPPKAAQEEKKSIFSSPLFYIVGGAILAGAATGGYFALRPTEYTPSSRGRTVIGASCGIDRCQ